MQKYIKAHWILNLLNITTFAYLIKMIMTSLNTEIFLIGNYKLHKISLDKLQENLV
jgi:hypothetical protein